MSNSKETQADLAVVRQKTIQVPPYIGEDGKVKAIHTFQRFGKTFHLLENGDVKMETSGAVRALVDGCPKLRKASGIVAAGDHLLGFDRNLMPTFAQQKWLAEKFFHRYEHEVILYLGVKDDGTLFTFIPKQEVAGSTVQVVGGGGVEEMPGLWVGDIHSHPWKGVPHPSGTDDSDMKKKGGLHGISSHDYHMAWILATSGSLFPIGHVCTEKMKASPIEMVLADGKEKVEDLFTKRTYTTYSYHGGYGQKSRYKSEEHSDAKKKQIEAAIEAGYKPLTEIPMLGTWVVVPQALDTLGQVVTVSAQYGWVNVVTLDNRKYSWQKYYTLMQPSRDDLFLMEYVCGLGAWEKAQDEITLYVPVDPKEVRVSGPKEWLVLHPERVRLEEETGPGRTRIKSVLVDKFEQTGTIQVWDAEGRKYRPQEGITRATRLQCVVAEDQFVKVNKAYPETSADDRKDLSDRYPIGALVLVKDPKEGGYYAEVVGFPRDTKKAGGEIWVRYSGNGEAEAVDEGQLEFPTGANKVYTKKSKKKTVEMSIQDYLKRHLLKLLMRAGVVDGKKSTSSQDRERVTVQYWGWSDVTLEVPVTPESKKVLEGLGGVVVVVTPPTKIPLQIDG